MTGVTDVVVVPTVIITGVTVEVISVVVVIGVVVIVVRGVAVVGHVTVGTILHKFVLQQLISVDDPGTAIMSQFGEHDLIIVLMPVADVNFIVYNIKLIVNYVEFNYGMIFSLW